VSELGRLFVRIDPQTGEFEKGIDSAEKKTKQFSVRSAATIGGFAVAAVAAFRKISAAVQQSIALYGRQIDAEAGLQAAIRASGQEAEKVFPKYQDLANEIQALTVVGDEAALEMISLATSMGVTDDQMEDTIKGAIGLSDGFGISMQQALRGIANAHEGNFKLAIVQQAMAGGFEVSQAKAETAFGALKQYDNAVGDLQEQLGQTVAEGIEPFVRLMTSFVSRVAAGSQRARELQEVIDTLNETGRSGAGTMDQLNQAIEELEELEERSKIQISLRNQERARQIELLKVERAALARSQAQQAQYAPEQERIQKQREEAAERAAQAALDQAEAERQLAEQQAQNLAEEELRLEVIRQLEFEKLRIRGEAQAAEIAAAERQAQEEEDILNERIRNYEEFAVTLAQTFSPVLEAWGEALSGLEDGWINLGRTIVRTIAEIIRGLGQMCVVEAARAAAAGNIPGAAAFTSAAAGAFVAAGIVEGLAQQIQKAAMGADFVTAGPQLLMVGDNPGGRERVTVEPLSSPNASGPGGDMYVQINLDGQVISRFVTKAIRNNRILVDARAVI